MTHPHVVPHDTPVSPTLPRLRPTWSAEASGPAGPPLRMGPCGKLDELPSVGSAGHVTGTWAKPGRKTNVSVFFEEMLFFGAKKCVVVCFCLVLVVQVFFSRGAGAEKKCFDVFLFLFA